MKKIVLLITLISTVFAWDTFSVGIGQEKYQSATFYSNHLLYGLDFFHFGVDFKMDVTEHDWGETQYYQDSGEFSINVFMPRVGWRQNLVNSNKINTYIKGEGFIVIPFVALSGEGSGSIEEPIEDMLDMIGFNASYGVEYMFNEQFSISADVGLTWIINSFSTESSSEDYWYDSYQEINTKLTTSLATSFTKLSLNFKL
jgi:hypothetical protein